MRGNSNVKKSNVRTFQPLRFEKDDGGHVLIDSVEAAIQYVTDSWPVRNGKAFEEALQACIDGMAGRISPDQVRQALYKAAKEAGIHING